MSSNPSPETAPPEAAPPVWRRGIAGWSLRRRLVATVLVLLTLVSVAVGVATEVALYHFMVGRMDEQLHKFAKPPRDDPRRNDDGPSNDDGSAGDYRVLGPGGLNARVRDGTVLSCASLDLSTNLPVPITDTETRAILAALPANARPVTRDLGDLGTYRLIAAELPGGVVNVSGQPLEGVFGTLTQVAVVLGLAIAGALGLAGWGGAVLVRRNLRPLQRVAATAGRVAELRLDRGEVALAERVPDADPRTEVGQVGAALNRMLGHVQAALESRHASETQVRQFLADASHELRTPLASIRGYAELTRRSREPVSEDVSHALRRVESEAKRMTSLVEDMLLLARLDAGRPLAEEPVDLSLLAIDTVSDAHAVGPDHRWHLELPEDAILVTGDRARLHQVLANLLMNARTHTPAGTDVVVSIENGGGEARLRVTDNGPGIPPELVPHIFERFARGDTSRSRAAGSTGLGLAIVGAVVAAHHGTVTVDSAPGRTVFTVTLPGSSAQATDATDAMVDSQAAHRDGTQR